MIPEDIDRYFGIDFVQPKRRLAWLIHLRDLIIDVTTELSSRLARTFLMISAVAFSTGALITSVGISQNAAYQVDADIAASSNRLILVTVVSRDEGMNGYSNNNSQPIVRTIFPDKTSELIEKTEGVDSAGMRLDVDGSISTNVVRYPLGSQSLQVGVKGVTSRYMNTASIKVSSNSLWMLDSNLDVALLGAGAANRLGIPTTNDPRGVSIAINDTNYSIIGFVDGDNSFTDSAVIPYSNALRMVGNDLYAEVLIRTKLGAGSQVSKVARLAILPNTPEKLSVSQVIARNDIRSTVSAQLTRQATWIGGFLILLTALLITNSMVVSVTARTTEIGVRRALGSTRTAVAGVIWIEGALIGTLGGLTGSALAIIAIDAVAFLNHWTAYITFVYIISGPILGMTVGIVASLYPALRAAAIQPAIAVRSE